mmetsp:Transcript_50816/g.42742  ORF Transcript_50816/g.42742 Transcript_50816/m.42742 type:complete len:86 (-) Transcript_50816:1271-1528(-)
MLTYKDPAAAAAAAAASPAAAAAAAAASPAAVAAAAVAAGVAAAPLTPEEVIKIEEAKKAEEAILKGLDPTVDRHMEGKWRSKIW